MGSRVSITKPEHVFSLQSPIPVSLLQLEPSDMALNRQAVECFLGTLHY